MSVWMAHALHWAPRVLGILFALFISLFALDSFGGDESIWKQIGHFLIHLIPTYILVAAIVFAWRWEWVGAAVFILLGIWHLMVSWGRLHWSAYIIIDGLTFFIGILFLTSWIYHAQINERLAQ